MKFCLIGEKLSHSYSCDIHSLRNIDYFLNEISKEKLNEFVAKREYDGFNVTIPYKKEIIKYLDYVDSDATKIESVNTVVYRNGASYGYNTDIMGLRYLIEKNGVLLKNKVVGILGSGGAGRTAEFVARENNAKKIIIVSRKGEVNYSNYKEKLKDVQILINATPVGMYPHENDCPIDTDCFRILECVIDLIYNPLKSNMIINAENRKVKAVSGLDMLIYQGLCAEKIWLNIDFNEKDINEISSKILNNKLNIVLIGMPSCGKTTIGKIVSERLSKTFFDVDEEFANEYKVSPDVFIEKNGEESFRRKESTIVEKLSRKNGVVIATGGGSVLCEENVKKLKRNGVLFLIDRDLEKLTDKNRPISKNKSIRKLYSERKGKYKKAKDANIENNFSIESCVCGVIKEYENTCNKRR